MATGRASRITTRGDPSEAARRALAALFSDRQRSFVWEYLVDFNGARAAVRAGYSPRGANVQASRLLSNVNVKVALATITAQAREEMASCARRGIMERTELLEIDSAIARADITEVLEGGSGHQFRVRACTEWPWHVRQAVSSIRTQADGTQVVQFHSKHPSLGRLAQWLKLIGPTVVQIGQGGQEGVQEPEALPAWQQARLAAQWLQETAARLGTDSVREVAAQLAAVGPTEDGGC